jgi:hypothetical protein
MKYSLIFGLLIVLLAGCKSDEPSFSREIDYLFYNSLETWTGMFSDYPMAEEEAYELEFRLAHMPEPLDTNLTGVLLSGYNHGDDLFTYMFSPVSSLVPNTTYEVTVNILLATNIPLGSIEEGGSPDIAIGAGALDTIPINYLDESGWYRPSFEVKLQNDQSNDVMQVLGTLGATDTTTVYTAMTRNNYSNPIQITTNSEGLFYLLIGWDSGYVGRTTVYIKAIYVDIVYPG